MSNYAVESTKVTAPDNVSLHTRFFKPTATGVASSGNNLGIVWVDHYTVLGGCQGLLGGIASGLAVKGYKAATFDKRGAGKSPGRHSLTGFAEVKDVVAAWQWVCENAGVERMLLVGSSAGEPIAGSSVDQIEWVVGYMGSPAEAAEKPAELCRETCRDASHQRSRPLPNRRPWLR